MYINEKVVLGPEPDLHSRAQARPTSTLSVSFLQVASVVEATDSVIAADGTVQAKGQRINFQDN
jgi:hypothetical protein